MEKNLFNMFDKGKVVSSEEAVELGSLPWNIHKEFDGVYLKNVVTEDKTDGLFTCLLVRIEPGKKIGMHVHPSSIELHEVIAGGGTCATEQGDIAYIPGTIAVLAANSPHEVRAGANGLCLFSKFINVPG